MDLEGRDPKSQKKFHIPKVKCSPKEGYGQVLEPESIPGKEITSLIEGSATLQKQFKWSSKWRLRTITLVKNVDFQQHFFKKKQELKLLCRELSECYAFGLTKSDTEANDICSKGVFTGQILNVPLGNVEHGVNVCLYPDVLLQWAEKKEFNQPCIVIYKILKGRRKTVKARTSIKQFLLDPTPNTDYHISDVNPTPDEPIFSQLSKSQMFLYEYDKDALPVKRPRHCLPHAVISFRKRSRTPPPPSLTKQVSGSEQSVRCSASKTSKELSTTELDDLNNNRKKLKETADLSTVGKMSKKSGHRKPTCGNSPTNQSFVNHLGVESLDEKENGARKLPTKGKKGQPESPTCPVRMNLSDRFANTCIAPSSLKGDEPKLESLKQEHLKLLEKLQAVQNKRLNNSLLGIGTSPEGEQHSKNEHLKDFTTSAKVTNGSSSKFDGTTNAVSQFPSLKITFNNDSRQQLSSANINVEKNTHVSAHQGPDPNSETQVRIFENSQTEQATDRSEDFVPSWNEKKLQRKRKKKHQSQVPFHKRGRKFQNKTHGFNSRGGSFNVEKRGAKGPTRNRCGHFQARSSKPSHRSEYFDTVQDAAINNRQTQGTFQGQRPYYNYFDLNLTEPAQSVFKEYESDKSGVVQGVKPTEPSVEEIRSSLEDASTEKSCEPGKVATSEQPCDKTHGFNSRGGSFNVEKRGAKGPTRNRCGHFQARSSKPSHRSEYFDTVQDAAINNRQTQGTFQGQRPYYNYFDLNLTEPAQSVFKEYESDKSGVVQGVKPTEPSVEEIRSSLEDASNEKSCEPGKVFCVITHCVDDLEVQNMDVDCELSIDSLTTNLPQTGDSPVRPSSTLPFISSRQTDNTPWEHRDVTTCTEQHHLPVQDTSPPISESSEFLQVSLPNGPQEPFDKPNSYACVGSSSANNTQSCPPSEQSNWATEQVITPCTLSAQYSPAAQNAYTNMSSTSQNSGYSTTESPQETVFGGFALMFPQEPSGMQSSHAQIPCVGPSSAHPSQPYHTQGYQMSELPINDLAHNLPTQLVGQQLYVPSDPAQGFPLEPPYRMQNSLADLQNNFSTHSYASTARASHAGLYESTNLLLATPYSGCCTTELSPVSVSNGLPQGFLQGPSNVQISHAEVGPSAALSCSLSSIDSNTQYYPTSEQTDGIGQQGTCTSTAPVPQSVPDACKEAVSGNTNSEVTVSLLKGTEERICPPDQPHDVECDSYINNPYMRAKALEYLDKNNKHQQRVRRSSYHSEDSSTSRKSMDEVEAPTKSNQMLFHGRPLILKEGKKPWKILSDNITGLTKPVDPRAALSALYGRNFKIELGQVNFSFEIPYGSVDVNTTKGTIATHTTERKGGSGRRSTRDPRLLKLNVTSYTDEEAVPTAGTAPGVISGADLVTASVHPNQDFSGLDTVQSFPEPNNGNSPDNKVPSLRPNDSAEHQTESVCSSEKPSNPSQLEDITEAHAISDNLTLTTMENEVPLDESHYVPDVNVDNHVPNENSTDFSPKVASKVKRPQLGTVVLKPPSEQPLKPDDANTPSYLQQKLKHVSCLDFGTHPRSSKPANHDKLTGQESKFKSDKGDKSNETRNDDMCEGMSRLNSSHVESQEPRSVIQLSPLQSSNTPCDNSRTSGSSCTSSFSVENKNLSSSVQEGGTANQKSTFDGNQLSQGIRLRGIYPSRTRSPNRRSRSPNRRSRAPNRRSRSPNRRSRSPNRRSRSPNRRSISPNRRSRSPNRRSRSPNRRSRSPNRRSRSPNRRSRSPNRRSRSPNRRSRSPNRRSRSPNRRSRSPNRRSRSPNRRSRSPNRRSRSPNRRSRSPNRRSRSPNRRSRSPNRRSRSPNRRSRSPNRRGRSPNRRGRSPDRRGRSPDRRGRSPNRRSRSPNRRSRSPNRRSPFYRSGSSHRGSGSPYLGGRDRSALNHRSGSAYNGSESSLQKSVLDKQDQSTSDTGIRRGEGQSPKKIPEMQRLNDIRADVESLRPLAYSIVHEPHVSPSCKEKCFSCLRKYNALWKETNTALKSVFERSKMAMHDDRKSLEYVIEHYELSAADIHLQLESLKACMDEDDLEEADIKNIDSRPVSGVLGLTERGQIKVLKRLREMYRHKFNVSYLKHLVDRKVHTLQMMLDEAHTVCLSSQHHPEENRLETLGPQVLQIQTSIPQQGPPLMVRTAQSRDVVTIQSETAQNLSVETQILQDIRRVVFGNFGTEVHSSHYGNRQ